ncbi:MAG: sodium:proton antiporter [Flavobacteriaceae bacterium CG_4_8_14_3_um_filter_34_10]|nr:sodium:proton antiporter [Flavobacteriia bacterium]OIP51863.1 MAG: sodium:proton antiporter [Flavobacteriaceae bacterium CG2_30_34_30]PIQ17670.1 MAG: sodium:proton antiporter [Flavobacteriaceae bacterium CG18_big_fil_WC_8_21_14_2_50_34_36]PIV51397.1 MAG: sodium:proton antiporter [Flavobacteriaceae bacterium CG02_land_8_20_14_3_00_34_13]PIX08477.1 MAG: sodium:proton antiporter [Flavobacteriaceae bacterium CG_4_8_14_3_um_filter_34_10]PIZ08396.1 MAG: sodium:proton antiporter [Flavobacteriaceae
MSLLIISLFVIGYISITLEHPLKLDKTVSALLMATVLWAIIALGFNQGWLSIIDYHGNVFNMLQGDEVVQKLGFQNNLMHHFSKAGEILFFLIGAMTIVEIIDLHRGFDIIKGAIKTTSKIKLLWTLGILAFFLSAVIDNLTTIIILITLLTKLIPKHEYRVWYASLLVIAANAGGAWSPIGDVTTTMLWIDQKVTAVGLAEYVIIPSILCFVVPFIMASRMKAFKGETIRKVNIVDTASERLLSSKKMLYVGLGAILFVPIFKGVTGLPPYIGMLFSLAIVWLVSEYVKPVKNFNKRVNHQYSTHKALSRVEFASVLFFLGILLAVSALESLQFGSINGESVGTLRYAAESLSAFLPNMDIVIVSLGLLSAVLDNVPLVAASMAMYDFPRDASAWHFIAYCAGTGGSLLVIGSAAGVAAMGMEKINFMWYLKNITLLAFAGFMAGAITFILMEHFVR